MKKLTSILAMAGIVTLVSSCKKEAKEGEINNVSTTYKAFVIDWTADWCGPCGSNGVPAFQGALSKYKYEIVGVSLHKSDGIVETYPITTELKDLFSLGGTPQFVVGTDVLQAGSTAIDGKISTQIGANGEAFCGIGISKSVESSKVTINYHLKFFKDYTEGAKVLFLAIENNIPGDQTGNPSLTEHDEVVRAGQFSSIATGSISKGTSYEGTVELTLPADLVSKDNVEVVAVVFNSDASAHLNSNSTQVH